MGILFLQDTHVKFSNHITYYKASELWRKNDKNHWVLTYGIVQCFDNNNKLVDKYFIVNDGYGKMIYGFITHIRTTVFTFKGR